MLQTLLDLPFDHYQRYAAAAQLIQSLGLEQPAVLEVGANRQRLLGQFLPGATLLYTDLHAEGDDKDFVVADATNLPFQNQEFDVVVSLDVLEHVPAGLRAKAVSEMSRVSKRAVILGFPPDRPWVHEAESNANGRWFELFDENYIWLEEHKEFGLVKTEEVEATLTQAGMSIQRFGQGNAKLWAGLMGAHFIKVKYPELAPLVAAADRLYNSRVFAGDHSDQPYREYYVGLRDNQDVDSMHANSPFQNELDTEAVSLLTGLADGLRGLALRTFNAEKEWDSTARLLDAYQVDLDTAKRNWRETAAYAQQLQVMKDRNDADWMDRHSPVVAELEGGRAELEVYRVELNGHLAELENCRAELVRIAADVDRLEIEKEGVAQLAHTRAEELQVQAETLRSLTADWEHERAGFQHELEQANSLRSAIADEAKGLQEVVAQLSADIEQHKIRMLETNNALEESQLREARVTEDLLVSREVVRGLDTALQDMAGRLSDTELGLSDVQAEFAEAQARLERKIRADAVAYAHSRRKWTAALAMTGLATVLLASFLVKLAF